LNDNEFNQWSARVDISVKTVNEVKVLEFVGSLDTQTSPNAQMQLTQLIDEGATKILVNFDKLDYISSAGLRVLLFTAKRLKTTDGELRVCSLNEVVKEVFDISGFDRILPISASELEALEGF
jgi:anti-anti-sigma factor